MKTSFVFLVCFAALAISFCEETYDTRYDNINIDEILSNDRILSSHIRCLLGKGPCTKEGRQLRQDLPDAIETSCAKCSEAQKKLMRKACKHIIERKPDDWKILVNKFDPSGEHQEEFEKFLKEE